VTGVPAIRPAQAQLVSPTAGTDGPWPLTARTGGEGRDGLVSVGGVALGQVAAEYGTPAYVLDEADVRQRCRDYRAALGDGEVAYAAQAFCCRFMVRCASEEGLSLAVRSAGEIGVAGSVGFPPERLIVHGNAKTPADVRAALDARAGRIVIDSLGEIPRLAAQVPARQRVLLRVIPAQGASPHPILSPGIGEGGVPLADSTAAEAVRRIIAQPRLNLVGLHCHIGTQVTTPDDYAFAARRLLGLMAAVRDEHGLVLGELNLGGGHGVPHADGEHGLGPAAFARRVQGAVAEACGAARLPVPRITVEPGRAIVARAGVTLYRVVAITHRPGGRVFLAVDGGISDNPRPVLSGTAYSIRLARPATGTTVQLASVVGRHGEAGVILARDVPLAGDVHPGDLLVAGGTGAYHHAMASSYNMVGRPPVIAVRDGRARVLVRRETDADLRRRDVGL
jgi:diaminopimelate decarboxylase